MIGTRSRGVNFPFANPLMGWAVLGLGAIALSLWQTGLFQREILNPGGWEQFWRFGVASLHPDLSREMLHLTLDASLKTLAYAVCGTCFSVLLGLVGGVLCSEVWWAAVFPQRTRLQQSGGQAQSFWLTARAILAVPRAIHELIWGLFFVNLFGLDPLVGVLAIALPFGAITAKVFSELLDETPRQPMLVLLNSGVPPFLAFLYGLLPQAFLNLLSYTFYRFECSIRSAAVLGIIGAGGLGYQIYLSLQSLQYEQLWTFFYALFILNGCVDFASAWLRHRLGCASRLDLNLKQVPVGGKREGGRGRGGRSVVCFPEGVGVEGGNKERQGRGGRQGGGEGGEMRRNSISSPSLLSLSSLFSLILLVLLVFLGFLAVCFWSVGADFGKLWLPITWQRLGEILQACLPPKWGLVAKLPLLALQTVAMSVLAIALAATGGALLSFPAAHNFFLPGGVLNPNPQSHWGKIWAWLVLLLTRAFLLLCRAVPAPIWALVMLYVLFPGILPGAIALGLHNLGILGRLKAEVIENLDPRPLEALKSHGAPNASVFLYGVLPLTLPRFLAYALYRWEVCTRETVIVGLVGAGGLGRILTEQLSSFDYRGLIVTLGGFVLLTFVVDWVSGTARRSLR